MTKRKPKPSRKKSITIEGNAPVSVVKDVGGRPIEWTEERIEKKRLALEKWIADPKNYFLGSFLSEEKLYNEQIIRFCQYSPKFRLTYQLALAIQESRLVEYAITKKHDGNFTKFVLANKAGWKERNEVSGDPANPLAIILDRIALSAKDPLDYDE